MVHDLPDTCSFGGERATLAHIYIKCVRLQPFFWLIQNLLFQFWLHFSPRLLIYAHRIPVFQYVHIEINIPFKRPLCSQVRCFSVSFNSYFGTVCSKTQSPKNKPHNNSNKTTLKGPLFSIALREKFSSCGLHRGDWPHSAGSSSLFSDSKLHYKEMKIHRCFPKKQLLQGHHVIGSRMGGWP